MRTGRVATARERASPSGGASCCWLAKRCSGPLGCLVQACNSQQGRNVFLGKQAQTCPTIHGHLATAARLSFFQFHVTSLHLLSQREGLSTDGHAAG